MKNFWMNFSVIALIFYAGLAQAKIYNFDLPHMESQAIVKFKKWGENSVRIEQILVDFEAKVLEEYRSSGAVLLEFLGVDKGDFDSVIFELAELEEVEYIEANTYIYPATTFPNDPKLAGQWGLHNTGDPDEIDPGIEDADVDAPEAWELHTGSKNILVAVIDTGIDDSHPDIKPNYWHNPGELGRDDQGRDKRANGIDDDNNGYVDDWRGWDFVGNDNHPDDGSGHGTHVAGIIGAKGNNKVGISGVNWNVSLIGLKNMHGKWGETPVGLLSGTIRALEYATRIGALVTNNSYGGMGHSFTMEAAIEEANSKGYLFVAAAGNAGRQTDDRPYYPSCFENENVISVAASTRRDELANFSNFGVVSVDLAAPGDEILSTIPGSAYAIYSGTSQASPHVAGAVALMKARFPTLSGMKIKQRILDTVDPVPAFSDVVHTGGRLNLYKALLFSNY